MANHLVFQNLSIKPILYKAKVWLSSRDLAQALGYSTKDAVTKIFNQNSDEFSEGMTTIIETPKSGASVNLKVRRRIFSLRGAHLIAMFSRTPVAKEFRKWVLDLIEKESSRYLPAPSKPKVTEEKLPSGIYRSTSRKNPYMSSVYLDGKSTHLGVFPTIEDAVLARHEYLRKYHVNKVINANADIIPLAGVNARLLINIENGQVTYSKIMHPDAVTATPDNLPDVLKEYGWGKISIQQHQKIIEACVSVIARKCENLQLAK